MRLSPVARISVGLVILTTSLLLLGDLMGLTPGRSQAVLDARKKFCETLAVQFALAAQRNDLATIRSTMELAVQRNDEILSAGLRMAGGQLLVRAGDHETNWADAPADKSTPTHARVPIFRGEQRWGTVEVRFTPVSPPGVMGWVQSPLVRLILFVALAGFLSYHFYIRRALRHLDPSSVIPPRVKATLDVLAEGVVLLDDKERIVLANEAFAEKVGLPAEKLLGRKPAELPWKIHTSDRTETEYPWVRAQHEAQTYTGTGMVCVSEDGEKRTFMVNSAPILGGDGKSRGVLATFDDVTQLEEQNAKLEFLATRDPLTGCLNRRSFMERIEVEFAAAQMNEKPLTCIMADIDHFKAINDNHGHSVGDAVIQDVAEAMRGVLDGNELVCRYGGEEFCVLLPGIPLPDAAAIADRMRAKIETGSELGVPVTGSFGVSAVGLGASEPAGLIDEADKALYFSKNTGRNRVSRWDEVEQP